MPSQPREAVREAIIMAEVDRSVAKWAGTVPDHMLAKLREMAEEYYRTDPIAVRVINVLVDEATRDESGPEALPGAADPAPAKKGGERR